jgi:hypothetical protein
MGLEWLDESNSLWILRRQNRKSLQVYILDKLDCPNHNFSRQKHSQVEAGHQQIKFIYSYSIPIVARFYNGVSAEDVNGTTKMNRTGLLNSCQILLSTAR